MPGNAGSYRQVRSLAAEASRHYADVVRHDQERLKTGTRSLDFFMIDFNEDMAAFHGQTLLDQAEYVNEAISYILSLSYSCIYSVCSFAICFSTPFNHISVRITHYFGTPQCSRTPAFLVEYNVAIVFVHPHKVSYISILGSRRQMTKYGRYKAKTDKAVDSTSSII